MFIANRKIRLCHQSAASLHGLSVVALNGSPLEVTESRAITRVESDSVTRSGGLLTCDTASPFDPSAGISNIPPTWAKRKGSRRSESVFEAEKTCSRTRLENLIKEESAGSRLLAAPGIPQMNNTIKRTVGILKMIRQRTESALR